MTEELAPCPFCGSNEIRFMESIAMWFCYCKNCQAHGPIVGFIDCKGNEEKARAAWNERI